MLVPYDGRALTQYDRPGLHHLVALGTAALAAARAGWQRTPRNTGAAAAGGYASYLGKRSYSDLGRDAGKLYNAAKRLRFSSGSEYRPGRVSYRVKQYGRFRPRQVSRWRRRRGRNGRWYWAKY